MPIYDYECQSCGHRLEVMQKASEEVLTLCPSCQSKGLKKLLSAPRFQLKGEGWYETDFKKSKKNETKEKTAEKPKDKTKEESGTSS